LRGHLEDQESMLSGGSRAGAWETPGGKRL
jgi:hypothetical protein